MVGGKPKRRRSKKMKIKERKTTYKISMKEAREKLGFKGSVEDAVIHGEYLFITATEEETEI